MPWQLSNSPHLNILSNRVGSSLRHLVLALSKKLSLLGVGSQDDHRAWSIGGPESIIDQPLQNVEYSVCILLAEPRRASEAFLSALDVEEYNGVRSAISIVVVFEDSIR